MTSALKKKMLHFLDHLTGDKVVWIILLMLMLLSVLFIFSSSSRLTTANVSRVDIMLEHLRIVGLSLVLVILIYNIKSIDFFRKFSRWGFVASLGLLIFLNVKGVEVNGAVRFFYIGGFQFHVFEVVKIAMMMYLAWAIDMLETRGQTLLDKVPWLGEKLQNKKWRQVVFLYVPFFITILLVMRGSNTTALFLALLMIITIMVGTGEWRLVAELLLVLAVALGGVYSIYRISKSHGDNPPKFQRVGTAIGRVLSGDMVKEYHNATTQEDRQKALDKLRQPYSARIAIHQGKITGKGPGQSTQRYVVPDISEDYMFSFIVEEYGWGSLFVIMLYLSLLARGTLIIKNCANDIFAKSAIFGLVLLISGQAFVHIFVNMDPGILTGQTLPLLSHGSFAFICFSGAFGIILSISRIANRGMARASKNAEPLLAPAPENNDTVSEGLSDLEEFESNESDEL
jgi:cell division protein FtsW